MLQRRKPIMQIGRARLYARTVFHGKQGRPLAGTSEARAPFAIASVEQKYGIAGLKPQNMQQIMGLWSLKAQRHSGAKRRVDIKPRRANIVAGHRFCQFQSGNLL